LIPRPAASRARPVPFMPPPMMARSKSAIAWWFALFRRMSGLSRALKDRAC